MSKKVFYQDDEFSVWYELEQGEIFAHIAIHKVSRAVMERALQVWSEFKARAYFEGYERILTYTQDKRIFKWFPFAEYKGEIGNDNYKLGVWQWELK